LNEKCNSLLIFQWKVNEPVFKRYTLKKNTFEFDCHINPNKDLFENKKKDGFTVNIKEAGNDFIIEISES
jgi:hypothetical protein